MKNMKHLLKLVGALVLTSTAATSVVACGGEQQKTDQEYSDAIVKQLEAGIDGLSLNTLSTQTDALALFQAAVTNIKDGVRVALVTPGDAQNRLNSGNNTIQVAVTVGSVTSAPIDALLSGVTVATDEQYVVAIRTVLLSGMDGSTLNTLNTQTDALALFQAAVTNIKDGAKVELVIPPSEGTKKLMVGGNSIRVKVTVGSVISNQFPALLSGVTAPTDAQYVVAIKKTLEAGVDGSTLDDADRQLDAESLIQEALDKVVLDATFTFDDYTTPLTVENNTVNIKLNFNTIQNVAIAVKLINVAKQ